MVKRRQLSVADALPADADRSTVRREKVVPGAGDVAVDRQPAPWTDKRLVLQSQVGMPEAATRACLRRAGLSAVS